jgi:hypothetical protein
MYHQKVTDTKTLAIGITGGLESFCGAIKRFQRSGVQWNGFLSLKEQCARRIALIKNEQLKYFISGSLPTSLFQYVTKDIFNLQRDEFKLNYPKKFTLCDACSVVSRRKQQKQCNCPYMNNAIRKLSKHFSKRMNTDPTKIKKFEIIYKIPDDDLGDWDEPTSYFLYLSPYEDQHIYDWKEVYNNYDLISFQSYQSIHGQASVQEKLLFVDVMRFFGGFQTNAEQTQLILCHRCSVER